MRWISILGWILLAGLWLASVVFVLGVLWYQGPASVFLRIAALVAWLAISGGCAVWYLRWRDARAWLAYIVPFGVLLLWFLSIAPRNDRDWSPEMAHTLDYQRQGDQIVLSNVRNFNWTGPKRADERWETRHYDLGQLRGVDVLSLYWMGRSIAHTYFSFVWADGQALSLSVEIRKEKGEGYSPIGGFFKAYELAILAGDERDFYGWRVFYPAEDIELFHTRATPDEARKLLLEMLDGANKLARAPTYYNTLTDNCTTEAWMLTAALGAGRPMDRRMLISGYLPELLYELKILDNSRSLDELRTASHILPRAKSALDHGLEGPAFSAAIREGTPALAH